MANESNHNAADAELAGKTLGQAVADPALLQLFAAAIAQGMRDAQIDPDKETKKARWRDRLRAERIESERNRIAREEACGHVRSDNTSVVAWYTFNDNVTRGVCQRCNKLFVPLLDDGSVDPEYVRMVRVPTFVNQM